MPSRVAGQTRNTTATIQARIASMFGMHGKAAQHRTRAMHGSGESSAAKTGNWFSATGARLRGKGKATSGNATGSPFRQAHGNILDKSGQMKQNWNSRT